MLSLSENMNKLWKIWQNMNQTALNMGLCSCSFFFRNHLNSRDILKPNLTFSLFSLCNFVHWWVYGVYYWQISMFDMKLVENHCRNVTGNSSQWHSISSCSFGTHCVPFFPYVLSVQVVRMSCEHMLTVLFTLFMLISSKKIRAFGLTALLFPLVNIQTHTDWHIL